MGHLNQVLQLQYAQFWIPAAIFMVVVSCGFWLLRRPAVETVPTSAEVQEEPVGAVALVTAGPMRPKPPEHRYSKRREGNAIEVFVANPEDKNDRDRASVLDRSVGGIRLAAVREYPVGAVLAIRPVQVAEMVPWTDIEIRSCRLSGEIPGEYELGCQFVKSPPYSILLLFG